MRLLSKISATCFILLGLTLSASGQEGRGMHDFEYVRSSEPWTTSRNAAGLAAMPLDRNTRAEGNFLKENGGLIGNAGSNNSIEAGAMTESFLKISETIAFYGKISYSYFRGKDMGVSILMDPDYNPINFHESVDTTRGTKNKELYHLIGGISYKFKDSRWSLGAKVDYESGDQAKLKDPRFLNVWTDLDASVGFMYGDRKSFSIGMNLEYRRTIETILGKTYGVSGKQYYTFVDYGGYYGTRELFDGTDGMVTVGNTRPMFNNFFGASVQIEAGRKTKVFNELTYLRRSGYFGNRGTTSVMFTEHGGNILEYRGVLTAGKGSNRHQVGLDLRYEDILNYENVYRYNTQVGEHATVEYLSQNEVLDRMDISARLSYTGYSGVENYRPKWEYGARAGFNSRQSLTTVYPYYRSSGFSNASVEAFGKRSFISGKDIFTIGLEGCFLTGFGTAKSDGILANSTSGAPFSIDTYLYRDFEYRTATRAGGNVTLRYTRLFTKDIAGYIQLSDKFISLLKEPEYLDSGHRNTLTITIGCTF